MTSPAGTSVTLVHHQKSLSLFLIIMGYEPEARTSYDDILVS